MVRSAYAIGAHEDTAADRKDAEELLHRAIAGDICVDDITGNPREANAPHPSLDTSSDVVIRRSARAPAKVTLEFVESVIILNVYV